MSEKNYDPRMHTAEHAFNQTMLRLYNCGRAFSSHVEKKKTKLDYHFDRALTDEDVILIENSVNKVLLSGMTVSESFISREVASSKFNLSRLPEDAGDTLRIISIGDYDQCPCIGPHVQNTNEIGKVKIISHDFEENRLRIRFKLEN